MCLIDSMSFSAATPFGHGSHGAGWGQIPQAMRRPQGTHVRLARQTYGVPLARPPCRCYYAYAQSEHRLDGKPLSGLL
jgi:hypothetical protein